jgi:hypothetical protein
MRMRQAYIRRFTSAPSLLMCERACMEAHDFVCRSFNFRWGLGNVSNTVTNIFYILELQLTMPIATTAS